MLGVVRLLCLCLKLGDPEDASTDLFSSGGILLSKLIFVPNNSVYR